jgi:antitoxin MazE
MEEIMKVSKWGNSLAIRLPADVAAKLGVKEGDELYSIPGMGEEQSVKIARKVTRDERLHRLQEFRKTVKWPDDYKFDREEANSRED